MSQLAEALRWSLPIAGSVGLASLTYGTFVPASRFWGPVISRAQTQSPEIALTFDDGPTPGATDRVLDALGELHCPSAFFVVGRNARRWPALVKRMDDEGHLVGNHSFEHSHFGIMRRGGYWNDELRRTDEVIEQILGKRPALFRPPMGMKTLHVTRAARKSGHHIVTWTRRARDGVPTDAAHILQRLLDPAGAGDILLLHDGVEPFARWHHRSATVAAIAPLLNGLAERGLQPCRLDALLGIDAYAPAHGAAT